MVKKAGYTINKQPERVIFHTLFWLVSLGFFWILFSRNSGDRLNSAIFIAMLSPVALFTTYFFNYYLIPRFFITRNYFRFGWYSAITAIVALWVCSLAGIFIWFWRANCDMESINQGTIDVLMLVAALFFVVLMGVSAKLMRMNLSVQIGKEKVEKEIVELDNQMKRIELKFLKEQMNPHFLFNTLNNLYGLALEKSDKTPGLVMHLSNMLDYMLYRTDSNRVPIEQELEMINHYVSIEKHRFEDLHSIRFTQKGKPGNLTIAPLLLLPLVENCFKHGIRKSLSHSTIEIIIKIERSVLTLHTINSVTENKEEGQGGIGLTNLRKRLEMVYPGAYTLENRQDEKNYYSTLVIELDGKQKV